MFAEGKAGSIRLEAIRFHIVNDGSYHRGAIAHALNRATISHPVDGYAIYIHETKPEHRAST
jgi:uncharacterized damage-inducible protein DinB